MFCEIFKNAIINLLKELVRIKSIKHNLPTEKELKLIFKELMLSLKSERLNYFPIRSYDLAKKLDKTVNYINAVENGNEFPSMKLFLSYLYICQFDFSQLKLLKITPDTTTEMPPLVEKRSLILSKMLKMSEKQLDFINQQIEILNFFKIK